MPGSARHVACQACRERKIRCDGNLPSCRGCARKGKECTYDIIRAGDSTSEEVSHMLETLNERLAKAEAELAERRGSSSMGGGEEVSGLTNRTEELQRRTTASATLSEHTPSPATRPRDHNELYKDCETGQSNADADTPWSAGSTEATRIQEADPIQALSPAQIDELLEAYFNSLQQSFPIVNKMRYLQKLSASPAKPELSCLSYAIWTHGASCRSKYKSLEDLCYRQSRSFLEQVESSDDPTGFLTVEALQACLLIALYEIKLVYSARAWISVGRALRLAQLLKLHLLDSEQIQTSFSQMLGQENQTVVAMDWLELEEKRRIFWVGFIIDRCMNNGREWPMMLEESKMIDLPSAETSGAESVQVPRYPLQSGSLQDYLSAVSPPPLPTFAYIAVVAALWGQCMEHLHDARRPHVRMVLAADFWSRHQELDKASRQIFALGCSPSILSPTSDPNSIFLATMLHTITIYLHHSAVAYTALTGLMGQGNPESGLRCDAAARAIAECAKTIPALDLFAQMNPFTARCLYAAAQVLVHRIKELTGDALSLDSLYSILAIMDTWKRESPLVELYLKQISQELEGNETSDPTIIPY